MDKSKATKLRKAGWKIGSAEDFLELSPDEVALVEVKLSLSEKLKEQRADQGLTQTELAERLGSSQSSVTKLEASDPTVSEDLLLRGLFAAGASRSDVAGVIGKSKRGRVRPKGAHGNV